jgi:hypothetical protein
MDVFSPCCSSFFSFQHIKLILLTSIY